MQHLRPFLRFAFSITCFLLPASASDAPKAAAPDTSKASPAAPYRHHALLQKRMDFYAIYLPANYEVDRAKGKKYPLCVILHGSGSTETGHGSMALPYASQDVIFLAPRAPYPSYEVFLGSREPGFTAWPEFPEEWGQWDDARFPKEELQALDAVKLYADWIADCILDARKRYPIEAGKASVIGHSQGAAFAHELALHHPELIKAYAAYAGDYHFDAGDSSTARILLSGKVFPVILHSEKDSVVDVSGSRSIIAYLAKMKVPHQGAIFPGGSHDITSKADAAIRSFVWKWCLGKPAPPLRGDVSVDEVVKGSKADSMGLKAGDILRMYDGRKLSDVDAYRTAVQAAAGKPSVSVSIMRNGKPQSFTTTPGRLGIHMSDR
jgi:predicted esterase